jgi:hypothetical protein
VTKIVWPYSDRILVRGRLEGQLNDDLQESDDRLKIKSAFADRTSSRGRLSSKDVSAMQRIKFPVITRVLLVGEHAPGRRYEDLRESYVRSKIIFWLSVRTISRRVSLACTTSQTEPRFIFENCSFSYLIVSEGSR